MLPQSLRARPDSTNLVLQAAVCLSALIFFCLVEPADWLVCPYRRLTGMPCPLCGLTRALCAIGHGQFRRAVELHAVSPLIFALFVWGLAASLAQMRGWLPPQPASLQRRIFAALLVLLLMNWLWRLTGM